MTAAGQPRQRLRAARRAGSAARIVVRIAATSAAARLGIAPARRRRAQLGMHAARRLDALGGAYLKVGQVLSTRADLLSEGDRAALARLCDRTTPAPDDALDALRSASATIGELLVDVDARPLAAGSVAHVYRARRRDTGAPVAVKVLRPDARARFAADLAVIRGAARIAAHLPALRAIPVIDASRLLTDAVAAHLDLRVEAQRHRCFADASEAWSGVVVPRLHLELCGPRAIVMDLVEGARRIDDPALDPDTRRRAARAAVRALFAMLFGESHVHCDLHPGNLLVTRTGQLALIDFGYAVETSARDQRAFAELFLALALNDPEGVAEVIIRTAHRLPDGIDRTALARDLAQPVGVASGSTAEAFSVARFVATLFAVQRRHRIAASSGFAMGILALVTIEGLLKQLTPTLDFQREAMPFVLARVGRALPR
jgi:ubiquinone biosynthesis protein